MAMLLVVLLAVLPLLTHQQCWAPTESQQTTVNSHEELTNGQQTFSFDLLKEIAKKSKHESIFFSPLSVYKALVLAYFGTAEHTETSLKTALHIPAGMPKSEVMKAFLFEKIRRESRTRNSSTGLELSISNHLFFSNHLQLKDCIAIVFNDETSMMDFVGNVSVCRQKINSWVEAQTHGHIKDMLQANDIDPTTQLVLVNTAYFKGEWESGFKTSKQEQFHAANLVNYTVTMMRQTGTFSYYVNEDLSSHILELPYKGEQVSMYILMPKLFKINNTDGVDRLIQQLDPATFNGIINTLQLASEPVVVALPKFTVEKSLDLPAILEKLGVGDLFRDTADLSGFTGNHGLLLNEAKHKAKIEVDENGTKAAAATMLFGTRSSRPNNQRVIINKPFVYILYDNVDKAVLFAGVFRSPVA